MIKPKAKGVDQAFADLEQRHQRAVEVVAMGLNTHLDAMMSAGWGWTDGSRDIVDTGDLMASGMVNVSGGNISVSYGSSYASMVHYGGYIYPYGNTDIERVYLPARPWIAATFGTAAGPIGPYDWMSVYSSAIS